MEHLDAASRCESDHGPSGADGDKALRIAALGTTARNGAAIGENAPRRTRTFDPLIKSHGAGPIYLCARWPVDQKVFVFRHLAILL
jgi:hypothetical protein